MNYTHRAIRSRYPKPGLLGTPQLAWGMQWAGAAVSPGETFIHERASSFPYDLLVHGDLFGQDELVFLPVLKICSMINKHWWKCRGEKSSGHLWQIWLTAPDCRTNDWKLSYIQFEMKEGNIFIAFKQTFNSPLPFPQGNNPPPWAYFHCIHESPWLQMGENRDLQRLKIQEKNLSQQTQSGWKCITRHFVVRGFFPFFHPTVAEIGSCTGWDRTLREPVVPRPDFPDIFLTGRMIKLIRRPFIRKIKPLKENPHHETEPKQTSL